MWDGSVVQPESIDPEADVDRRVLLRNGVSWGYALRPLLQLDLVVQSSHRVLVLARGCLRGCNNHMSHCREWWVAFSLGQSKLEPKCQSHFGNFIDNTSLALHKFQAKSEVFPKRIENVNGHNSRQRQKQLPFLLCCCLVRL